MLFPHYRGQEPAGSGVIVSPLFADAGDVAVGGSSVVNVSVYRSIVDTFEITSSSSEFSAPNSITTGDSAVILPVTFTPGTAGRKQATLRITSPKSGDSTAVLL